MEDRKDLPDSLIPGLTKGAVGGRGGGAAGAAAAAGGRLKEAHGEGHGDLGLHSQGLEGGVEAGQGGREGAGEGGRTEAFVRFAGQGNVFEDGIKGLERSQGFECQ